MFINRNPSYFLTIAREQNITRAAEKLFVTQSSLSQHLAKLEQALGTQLIDRSQNPLALTPAGKIYQRYLESEAFLYNQLMDDLKNDRMQSLDVGIGTWRGGILLPEVLPGFLEDYPSAQVNLHEFPVSELFARVEDNQVDFALMNTISAAVPGGLVAETILEERIFLLMSRKNPLAREFDKALAEGGKIDLHALTEQRYIALNSSQTVGRHAENFFQKKKLYFPRRLVTTNNRTALRLAAQDVGFCLMVEQGLAEIQSQDEFYVFDLQDPDLRLPLSLVYKVNAYRSPMCQDLIERIQYYYETLAERNNAFLQKHS